VWRSHGASRRGRLKIAEGARERASPTPRRSSSLSASAGSTVRSGPTEGPTSCSASRRSAARRWSKITVRRRKPRADRSASPGRRRRGRGGQGRRPLGRPPTRPARRKVPDDLPRGARRQSRRAAFSSLTSTARTATRSLPPRRGEEARDPRPPPPTNSRDARAPLRNPRNSGRRSYPYSMKNRPMSRGSRLQVGLDRQRDPVAASCSEDAGDRLSLPTSLGRSTSARRFHE